MKNLLTAVLLCVVISVSRVFAQSNVTWTIKDKLVKGEIKTLTVLNSNFSGFISKQEAIVFCQKLKKNPEFASCDIISNNTTNCDIKLIMKQTHDKMYYVGLAQKLGVAYFEVNGTKKTPQEIALAKRRVK